MENLTAHELVDKFVKSGLMVGRNIIEEIVRRDDIYAHLSNIMREDRYWEIGKEGDAWSPIHTFFILGLKKDDRAFEILRYAIRYRVEELDDWIPADLPSILYSFGTTYFDEIKEIALDTSLDMYVRLAAIETLCAFGVVNNELTGGVAKLCKQLLMEERNEELIGLALPHIAEIKDEELFEMIKEFYIESEFAKDVIDIQGLTELHSGKSDNHEYTHSTKNLWEHFSKGNLDYRRRITEKAFKKPAVQIKTKKIGRNDPCPCGSGKKYKKCCGRVA